MRRSVMLAVWASALWASAASAQVTVNITTRTVLPWDEYATTQVRDAWDMAQRTDIGAFTWGVDSPPSNLTGKRITTDPVFGHTIFSATPLPSSNDPSFFLVDSPSPGGSTAYSRLGRHGGGSTPIDTTKYTHLYVKMRIANELKPPAFTGTVPVMQVYWSRQTIYYDATLRPNGGFYTTVDGANNQVGTPFTVSPPGCNGVSAPCSSMEGGRYVIHAIPLGSLAGMQALNSNIAKWKNVDPAAPSTTDINWGAPGVFADSLRFKPVNLVGTQSGTVDVDWVRLVAPGAEPAESVTWAGGSRYDVVISTAADCGASNGNFAVIGYNQETGFTFNPRVLPAGVYRVGLRDRLLANGSDTPETREIRGCSTNTWTVADYPNLAVTAPSPTGSNDDFATVVLGNAWDFDATSDLDLTLGMGTPSIVTVAGERPTGESMGDVRALKGTSTVPAPGNVGDPYAYLMLSSTRGLHNRIDASRYRLFTIDLGIDAERDLAQGSIFRLVWHIAGETWNTVEGPAADAENVTEDVLLNHFKKGSESVDGTSARYVFDRLQFDVSDRFLVPLESDAPTNVSSPSRTGWSNNAVVCAAEGCATHRVAPFDRVGIDNFRIDFHEFTPATDFYVTGVKLAAHERLTSNFAITWTSAMPEGQPTGTYNTAADWKVRLYAVPTRPAQGDDPESPGSPRTTVCSASGQGIVTLTANGAEPTLAAGTFSMSAAVNTGSLTVGALYFICAGLIPPGTSTPAVFNLSTFPVIYEPSGSNAIRPRLYLDRADLRLSATHTGALSPPNLSAKTAPQTITVAQVGGSTAVDWVVDVCQNYNYDPDAAPCTNSVPYIALSRTSGSGTGTFTVSLQDSSVLPLSTGATPIGVIIRVREATPGATATPAQYVQAYITIYGPSEPTAPPIGMVDTPAQNATGVQGAVGITGWVVDDLGVESVQIYRECLQSIGIDGACQTKGGYNVIYVGQADFVPGVRPDVEAAFPTYPQAHRGGWGYQVLTNMLPHIPNLAPNGGQGELDFFAFATDAEGNEVLLGRDPSDHTPTTVTLANDTIAKPFGAIDTPAQGGSTSGNLANFGWALTPDTNTTAGAGDILIPTNGSTIAVFVDGVNIGNVTYNQCRVGANPVPPGQYCVDDVASIFGNTTPQLTGTPRSSNPTLFRNLDAGRAVIGSFDINTALYSNGRHSIAWSVRDSANRIEGIGSRNFMVVNGVSDPFDVEEGAFALLNPMGLDVGRDRTVLDPLAHATRVVPFRTGWDPAAPLAPAPRRDGIAVVEVDDLDRVEVALPRTLSRYQWEGYLVQHGRLVPLPAGSFLDSANGRFTWQPTAGVFGAYEFEFVRRTEYGLRERVPVRVTFGTAGQR